MKIQTHTAPCLLVAFLLAASLGCRSTYDMRYRYQPRPAVLHVAVEKESPDTPVHVLVSVVGVRSEKAEVHPGTLEVRMRVDNTSPLRAAVDPASLKLFSADLKEFGRAFVEPATAVYAGPDSAAELTAYFPFPTKPGWGVWDVEGVGLRWTLLLADGGGNVQQSLAQSMAFNRRRPIRDYPDYYEEYEPWRRNHIDGHFHFYGW